MLSLFLYIAFIHFMGLISPGPDFFYISRTGASRGMAFAVAASFGISLGVAVWALATVLGLSFLFEQFPVSKGILFVLGGSYLAFLGYKMLKVRTNVSFDQQQAQNANSLLAEVGKGLWVNLSNAKVVAYFAGVMSMVLAKLDGAAPFMVILLIFVETFLYFCLVGLIFSRAFARQFYSQYSRYIDNAAGVIFAFFGLYLVYSGLQLFI